MLMRCLGVLVRFFVVALLVMFRCRVMCLGCMLVVLKPLCDVLRVPCRSFDAGKVPGYETPPTA